VLIIPLCLSLCLDRGRRKAVDGYASTYNCNDLYYDTANYSAGATPGSYTLCLQIWFGYTTSAGRYGLTGSVP